MTFARNIIVLAIACMLLPLPILFALLGHDFPFKVSSKPFGTSQRPSTHYDGGRELPYPKKVEEGAVVGPGYLLVERIHPPIKGKPAPPPPSLDFSPLEFGLPWEEQPGDLMAEDTWDIAHYWDIKGRVPRIDFWDIQPLRVIREKHREVELCAAPDRLAFEVAFRQPRAVTTIKTRRPSLFERVRDTIKGRESKKYATFERLGKGSFGEVWRAVSLDRTTKHRRVVLKRIMGGPKRLSGLREIHFHGILRDGPRVSRLLETFETGGELWLVFVDEGFSLSSHLFTPKGGLEGSPAMMGRSTLWYYIKQHPYSTLLLREIIRQLLEALKAAHSRGIVHRDVKLENILMPTSIPLRLRLGDWGSALQRASPKNDPRAIKEALSLNRRLYGCRGPTWREETRGCRPPEAIGPTDYEEDEEDEDAASSGHEFERACQNDEGASQTEGDMSQWRETSYDIWGAGLVLLQIVLGDPDPLRIQDDRKRAKMDRLVASETAQERERIILLHALADACIIRAEEDWSSRPPPLAVPVAGNKDSSDLHASDFSRGVQTGDSSDAVMSHSVPRRSNSRLASQLPLRTCTDSEFELVLKARDPHGLGLPNANARHFLQGLLHPLASKRMTAVEALGHPWMSEVPSER